MNTVATDFRRSRVGVDYHTHMMKALSDADVDDGGADADDDVCAVNADNTS